MSEGTRPSSRLSPSTSWTTVTDAPLSGMVLAREAGTVLAWDEGRNLYLLGVDGSRFLAERTPSPVVAADISDDGSLVALLLGGPRLMLLDRQFHPVADRPAASGAACLAVDPHGRFVAVSSKTSMVQLYTRFGKAAGQIELRQAPGHLRFVPSSPTLLAATGFGALVAVTLTPSGADRLGGEAEWEQRLMANVGRLEVSGDGSLILASSYNLGIQRYDARGRNEGSYHLGGTATHAVPDFAGRSIAAATLEGELYVLNQGGNVKWKTGLPRAVTALGMDALGRFLIYGLPTGEIVRLDLETSPSASRRAARHAAAPSPRAGIESGAEVSIDDVAEFLAPATAAATPARGGGSVRQPDWSIPVARTEEEAEAAVVAVLDDPPLVGFITRGNRLQIFTTKGESLGQAPEITGVGRIVRTSPGWMAAATDKTIVLYDARRNGISRVDLNLYQMTHLIVRPDRYGLAIVQERDRIGRATVAGRWIWRQELRTPVEDLALGPHGLTAVTCDDGPMLIYDAAGEPSGRFDPDPAESLLMVEAPEDSGVDGLAWITLARRAQVLRGHRGNGRVIWESPTPWEAWRMERIGPAVVVGAPDGRALAYDGSGYLRAQGGAEASPFVFAPAPNGAVWRVARRDVHLICSDLSGQVIWRSVAEAPLGPLAAGEAGVAAMVGKNLAFFSAR
jgi:hypothetical protein